jgi:hypothetical protein
MQQVGWRRLRPGPAALGPEQQASPEPAQSTRPGDQPAPTLAGPDRSARVGARARVRAAYETQLASGETPTGAGLARAAGVSERYGQRLLAEFAAAPDRSGHSNGDSPTGRHKTRDDPPDNNEGR